MRTRVRYEAGPRLWLALGSDYNSGLPFQPDLTPQQYATEYGQVVINHLNFDRGRIRPCLTENASVGAYLYRREKFSAKLQADAQDLSNKLEVIDFGGLLGKLHWTVKKAMRCACQPIFEPGVSIGKPKSIQWLRQ